MASDVEVEAGSSESSNVHRVNFERKLESLEQLNGVERLMTALEVAAHLGCSDSRIYKAAVDLSVPLEERLPSYLVFGSLRRFRLSEVEAWLQRQRPRSPNRNNRNRRSAA